MYFVGKSSKLLSVIVFIVFLYVFHSVYNNTWLTHNAYAHRQSSQTTVTGRRPDDGAWFNFSVPPALLFFAYSAFVDVRMATPVIRVISMSTKSEEQRQRNISLFCVCNYKSGTVTVSPLRANPAPIGMGYPLYGITVREYVYACPLPRHSDTWPESLSISTKRRRHRRAQSVAMPVELGIRPTSTTLPALAVCVQVAYGRVDPVRLVEWLEFQRVLGASLVGVYLASDISRSAQTVFRHYADVDGLVDLRHSDYISRVVGGTKSSGGQYLLHGSPVINDCLYRHMYRFRRVAVIDFDEVRLLINIIDLPAQCCYKPSKFLYYYKNLRLWCMDIHAND